MRKVRKIHTSGQARKPTNKPARSEKWSDSARAFAMALELARLDIPQTKRSRPAGTSSTVYSPLLNQVIPPEGVALPPIEKLQEEDESALSLGNVEQSGSVRVAPVAFICTLYVSLVLGSLLHSWWVLGGSLLIGLILTGIVALAPKRGILYALMELLLWLLFALMCGYIGWLVCDSYLPLIIRCLCAFIGFILGLFVHYLMSGIINATEPKQMRGIKYCGVTTFVDSLCISLVFGFLLHSWWILGVSLVVGLILTGIIILSARGNVQTSVDMVWLLFALMWGYAGWFIFDSHIPSIIHFLCALIGFILGFVGYPLAYAILSPADAKERAIRETE